MLVCLLDNLTHIVSYTWYNNYTTTESDLEGAYTASNEHPVPEKGLAIAMWLDSLCRFCEGSWVLRYSCRYTRTCGDHVWIQDYNNDSTYCEFMTNYGFTHANFVQNVRDF